MRRFFKTILSLIKRKRELEIENHRLQAALSELEKSYDITLEALGDALELKEPATKGHLRRVTAFTIAIAKRMGLPKGEIAVIARERSYATSETWHSRRISC